VQKDSSASLDSSSCVQDSQSPSAPGGSQQVEGAPPSLSGSSFGRILVIKPCSMTLNIEIEGEMTNSSSECCCSERRGR